MRGGTAALSCGEQTMFITAHCSALEQAAWFAAGAVTAVIGLIAALLLALWYVDRIGY